MTIADMRRVRTALDADWDDLCASGPAPASWWCGVLPPRPDGLGTWADLAAHSDDLAAAALRAAQDGDRRAGRAVLHLLAPRLSALASRDPHHDLGDYVATAWLRIMTYPVATRPHALLVNLALDTLKELSRSYARLHRAVDQPPTDTVAEDEPDAAGILAIAASAGWLPRASEPVLRSVYCDGLSGREAARRHHTSPAMVRYRCCVGVKALRAHRSDLLAA
ncbi:MAG: hypothetical protein FWF75_09750 [Propionibacteriaceae bacterium]|nr:hypothetical protein [Propionibacteriaceae bacterium]